jgi:hypothetical protein
MNKKHIKHHHPSLNTLVLVTQFICKFESHIICGLSSVSLCFQNSKEYQSIISLFKNGYGRV